MFKGTLKELFEKLDTFEWKFGTFIESGEVTLDTECVCLNTNSDEVIDSGSCFKVILEGKEYIGFLNIPDIKDVIEYIEEQVEKPNNELKLKAVLYYYETDCFLDLSPES